MVLFVFSVAFVLTVWAACSLAEAAMYAVRMPYVRGLSESGEKAGRILADFKQNMERPTSPRCGKVSAIAKSTTSSSPCFPMTRTWLT